MTGLEIDGDDFDVAFGEGGSPGQEEDRGQEAGGDAGGGDATDGQDGGGSETGGEGESGSETEELRGNEGAGGEGADRKPEAGDDAGGAGDDDPAKLRQELKTLGGRAAALEARKKDLEEELAALRAGKGPESRPEGRQEGAGEGDGEKPATVEIPEDIQKDAEEFRETFPELYPLLEAAGPVGERLRKVLRESGADVAGIAAENIALKMRLDSVSSEVRAITREEHDARIEERHPETRGLRSNDPALVREADAFKAGLTAWVERQPWAEAERMKQVLKRGRAGDVIVLLDQYKATLNKKPDTPLDDDKRRRAEEAGAVGNRRPVAPLAGAPDPDDYDGALIEAFGLK